MPDILCRRDRERAPIEHKLNGRQLIDAIARNRKIGGGRIVRTADELVDLIYLLVGSQNERRSTVHHQLAGLLHQRVPIAGDPIGQHIPPHRRLIHRQPCDRADETIRIVAAQRQFTAFGGGVIVVEVHGKHQLIDETEFVQIEQRCLDAADGEVAVAEAEQTVVGAGPVVGEGVDFGERLLGNGETGDLSEGV